MLDLRNAHVALSILGVKVNSKCIALLALWEHNVFHLLGWPISNSIMGTIISL